MLNGLEINIEDPSLYYFFLNTTTIVIGFVLTAAMVKLLKKHPT